MDKKYYEVVIFLLFYYTEQRVTLGKPCQVMLNRIHSQIGDLIISCEMKFGGSA